MKNEMQSLYDNHTFEFVQLPKSKYALKNHWVFRVKHNEKSFNSRYKVNFIVKENRHKQVGREYLRA